MTLSRESMPEWDSMAAITLVSVLQEEFEIDIDVTDIERFHSVPTVFEYVNSAVPSSESGRAG